MPNPEIEKYVDTSLRTNLEPANIRRILIAAGWDPKEVDEAIAAQQASRPAAVAATLVQKTASAGGSKKSSKGVLIAVVVILIVSLAAGAAFAFYKGLFPGLFG